MFFPLPVIHVFVERHNELSELLDKLEDSPPRPSVIAITGSPGIGKSAFAKKFLEAMSGQFKPVWLSTYDREKDELVPLVIEEVRKDKRRALVVVDGADPFTEKNESLVAQLLRIKKVRAVFITARQVVQSSLEMQRFELFGLTARQAAIFLREEIHNQDRPTLSDEEIDMFVSMAGGNPAYLANITSMLYDHTVEQIKFKLAEGLHNLGFQLSASENQLVKVVVPKIVVANEALLQSLKDSPQDLRDISPRKFEELIAELLDDMGCDVKLTPSSKDGGKDIIAEMKTEIGNILCLVEAKHYSPNRPVQVNLVRELFGTYMDYGASSAMLVTTSRFTKGAKEFQSKHKYQISLKEYDDVVRWIQAYKR